MPRDTTNHDGLHHPDHLQNPNSTPERADNDLDPVQVSVNDCGFDPPGPWKCNNGQQIDFKNNQSNSTALTVPGPDVCAPSGQEDVPPGWYLSIVINNNAATGTYQVTATKQGSCTGQMTGEIEVAPLQVNINDCGFDPPGPWIRYDRQQIVFTNNQQGDSAAQLTLPGRNACSPSGQQNVAHGAPLTVTINSTTAAGTYQVTATKQGNCQGQMTGDIDVEDGDCPRGESQSRGA